MPRSDVRAVYSIVRDTRPKKRTPPHEYLGDIPHDFERNRCASVVRELKRFTAVISEMRAVMG